MLPNLVRNNKKEKFYMIEEYQTNIIKGSVQQWLSLMIGNNRMDSSFLFSLPFSSLLLLLLFFLLLSSSIKQNSLFHQSKLGLLLSRSYQVVSELLVLYQWQCQKHVLQRPNGLTKAYLLLIRKCTKSLMFLLLNCNKARQHGRSHSILKPLAFIIFED